MSTNVRAKIETDLSSWCSRVDARMTAIEITAAKQTTLIEIALKEAKDTAKFTTKVSFAMLSANLLMISIVLAALLHAL
jgi:hypothetical protein